MSLMHTYHIRNQSGITVEQLMGMLTAMGMNPQLYNEDVTVASYTRIDEATGRITFDTSILGGATRQTKAVVICKWDKDGNIIGDIQFRSDSWGVSEETDHFAEKLSEALNVLAQKATKAMDVGKTTKFIIPGTSSASMETILLQFGISKSEISTGTGVTARTPLSMKKARMKQAVSKRRPVATGYRLGGRNAKTIKVTVKTIDGNDLVVEVGRIEPTFTIEDQADGSCAINIPQAFFQEDEVLQDLNNLRSIALAALTAEKMAEKAVGADCKPEVEMRSGVVQSASIHWNRPSKEVKARLDAVSKGTVRISDTEAKELALWNVKPDPQLVRQMMIAEAAKLVKLRAIA